MASAISLILAVNGERILRRKAEAGIAPALLIRISTAGVDEDMRELLVDEIARLLDERAIAIEPAGIVRTARIATG